jgi:4-hydroxybenzoate polyprenyltransferase
MSATEPPLYVDLDGTLASTDLLYESFLSAVRSSPLVLLRCFGWAMRGRVCLKEELAARASIDVASLPYRAEVIEFLREERARGRRIVLTTAAWSTLAQAVSSHLGLFDDVIATSREGNVKGAAKARRIAEAGNPGGFDYLGDSAADLHVWRHCRHAYVVEGSAGLARRIPEGVAVKRVFSTAGAGAWNRDAVRALRPHQWAKNLLVFVPAAAAHLVADPAAMVAAAWAFAAFCLTASAGYILNDLLDLGADRAHPRKRDRPFAAGRLSIPHGAVLFAGCIIAAGAIALMLPAGFALALGLYFLLAAAYSLALKRAAMLDAIVLAALYTLRIIAGTFAIAVALSFWMLAFAMFIFFSLALVKRYAELAALEADGIREAPGRAYSQRDQSLVLALGTSSGVVSALVLALYINGETAKELYSHPQWLWLLCPILLYWVSRVWAIAARGLMHDDPVVFALRDPASYAAAALGALVVLAAT